MAKGVAARPELSGPRLTKKLAGFFWNGERRRGCGAVGCPVVGVDINFKRQLHLCLCPQH